MKQRRYVRSDAERIPEWPATQAVLADLLQGSARTVEIAERTHYSLHTVRVVLHTLKRLGMVEIAPGWRWRVKTAAADG